MAGLPVLALLATLGRQTPPARAQASEPLTRADAELERDAFLKTYRWDEDVDEDKNQDKETWIDKPRSTAKR